MPVPLKITVGTFAPEPDERARLVDMARPGDSEAMYMLFLDVAEREGDEPAPTKEEYEKTKQWLLVS